VDAAELLDFGAKSFPQVLRKLPHALAPVPWNSPARRAVRPAHALLNHTQDGLRHPATERVARRDSRTKEGQL
jgi:hypothetical protein